jgi:hypothetical protein
MTSVPSDGERSDHDEIAEWKAAPVPAVERDTAKDDTAC